MSGPQAAKIIARMEGRSRQRRCGDKQEAFRVARALHPFELIGRDVAFDFGVLARTLGDIHLLRGQPAASERTGQFRDKPGSR